MGSESSPNLIVEGDNLAVLKLLQATHRGAVKMIYIDPPYNTGKSFVYADARDHAQWLSLMYPRLSLARALLRDDGVLFVSIDDREVHHLRCILDEIYGEENFCGVIKRRAARKTAFLSKSMSDVCDYVAVYGKRRLAQALAVSGPTEKTRPVFNAGNRTARRVVRAGTQARCAEGTYPAGRYAARSLAFALDSDLVVGAGTTQNDVAVIGAWRVNQHIVDRSVFVTRNFTFRRHVLAAERAGRKTISDLLEGPAFYNERGSEQLKALLGVDNAFEHPKPYELIDYLATACGVGRGDVVLDFFAGSGSTGEAIVRRADGSSFILVQSAEPIVRSRGAGAFAHVAEITRARLRRVCATLGRAGPPYEQTGFRALRLTAPP